MSLLFLQSYLSDCVIATVSLPLHLPPISHLESLFILTTNIAEGPGQSYLSLQEAGPSGHIAILVLVSLTCATLLTPIHWVPLFPLALF